MRKITLEEGLSLLAEKGYPIIAAGEDENLARAHRKSAAQIANPALSFGGENMFGEGENYSEYEFGVEKTFSLFGAYWSGRKAGQLKFEADSLLIADRVRQSKRDFKILFYRGIYQQQRLAFLDSVSALVADIYKITKIRHEENVISHFDLYRISAKQFEYRRQRLDALEERGELLQSLLEIMLPGQSWAGIELEGSLALFDEGGSENAGTNPDGPASRKPVNPKRASRESSFPNIESLKPAALELKALALIEKSLEAKVKEASLKKFPDVTLRAGGKTQSDGLDGVTYGASASIPVFNTHQDQNIRAKASLNRFKLDKKNREAALQSRMARLKTQAIEMDSLLRADEILVPQENFKRHRQSILLNFYEGARSLFETVESIDFLYESVLNFENAKLKALILWCELEYLSGKELL